MQCAWRSWRTHPSGGIDDSVNEPHGNVPWVFPVLHSKVLDFNMTRAISRHPSVDHIDGWLVITVRDSRALRGKSQLSHDHKEVLSVLCWCDSCHEFSLSGTSGCDWLCRAAAWDGTTTEHENAPSSRAAIVQVIGVHQSDPSIQSQSHIEPHSRKRSSAHRQRDIHIVE